MALAKVIYGSNSGNTENAAKIIAGKLNAECINITNANVESFNADLLILGTSTWGIGELQDDWIDGLPLLERIDLTGKKVALFGLGDQAGFGDSFIDGVGALYERVTEQGGVVIGTWDKVGYDFSSSRADIDNKFVGLALDDDVQPEMTVDRISKWCEQLKIEAGL